MKLATKNYAPPDPAKIDADNPEALRFWARTLEMASAAPAGTRTRV